MTVLASLETDVRSAPLISNVALPVYRTFMAHKYRELSMISLLYYHGDAYRRFTDKPGRARADDARELLFRAILYRAAHTYTPTPDGDSERPVAVSRWSCANSPVETRDVVLSPRVCTYICTVHTRVRRLAAALRIQSAGWLACSSPREIESNSDSFQNFDSFLDVGESGRFGRSFNLLPIHRHLCNI